MPFQVKDKTERFKLPALAGVPNVFFNDLIGTERKDVADPIVGAWFRMEKGPESTPPTYEYDEFGVVIDGEFNFRDETGESTTVKTGDVFFFTRGSTITFSSDSYGLAVKCRTERFAKL
ncbi:uncharacterized protein APUU_61399S [Aspergillus puulaauensis]|uniref:(S)-ureidoglycine aminohydrolase cupin domain-containing protein n=1 Tax=Aspergillus puulaauensis TaxID=1220207 RepID=A0A7R7XV69_9EURO|nr:uncharacterized protein APUU_61399S [Aspergillus puulaauensis]BCS28351.1 hypothetical protein APUU_61399S [Aspergillus puulaauensis]